MLWVCLVTFFSSGAGALKTVVTIRCFGSKHFSSIYGIIYCTVVIMIFLQAIIKIKYIFRFINIDACYIFGYVY